MITAGFLSVVAAETPVELLQELGIVVRAAGGERPLGARPLAGGAEPPQRAPRRPPDATPRADGRRHCGAVERILFRQWDAGAGPPSADLVRAIENLAALPDTLKETLAAGLDAIYVGPGGV